MRHNGAGQRVGAPVAAPKASVQVLARICAVHPLRVLIAWGLVLIASLAMITTLLGSALTSASDITTRPESWVADEVLSANMDPGGRVDEVVVIRSGRLSAEDVAFRSFVGDVRRSLEATRLTQTVSDPYAAPAGDAVSADRHAVAVTVLMGPGADDGFQKV